jgi:hypothetical protein
VYILSNHQIQKINIPDGFMPCWYVEDRSRVNALLKNTPFVDLNSFPHNYFKITKRYDNKYVEGNLAFIDSQKNTMSVHTAINPSYTYFGDYNARRPAYFTFDKISLYELIGVFEEKELRLVLKRLENVTFIKHNQAFMIMPFGIQDLDQFYQTNIKTYLKETLNIDVIRSSDILGNDIIVDTIYNLIDASEFIIAETTLPNKNVFYEIGYAAAAKKEIITVQSTSDKNVFFDRAHIRTLFYANDKLDTFKDELKNSLVAIRQKYRN